MAINTLFQNIANAIRSVNSSSDTYTPEEMPEAIMNLSNGDMLKSEYDPNETVLDAGGIEAYTAEAIAGKADSATTLAGYGIADAYTITQVDTLLSGKANSATTLAGYGISDAYTKTETDTLLGTKANSSSTLAGYGITDAYTKTETDTLLEDKADASDLSTLSETVSTNTSDISTLNSSLTPQSVSFSYNTDLISDASLNALKIGKILILTGYIVTSTSVSISDVLLTFSGITFAYHCFCPAIVNSGSKIIMCKVNPNGNTLIVDQTPSSASALNNYYEFNSIFVIN